MYTDTYGCARVRMDVDGRVRLYTGACGYVRVCACVVQVRAGARGCARMRAGTCGCVRVRTGPCGGVRVRAGVCGCVRAGACWYMRVRVSASGKAFRRWEAGRLP